MTTNNIYKSVERIKHALRQSSRGCIFLVKNIL